MVGNRTVSEILESPNPSLECCDTQFPTRSALLSHLRSSCPDTTVHCPLCQLSMSRRDFSDPHLHTLPDDLQILEQRFLTRLKPVQDLRHTLSTSGLTCMQHSTQMGRADSQLNRCDGCQQTKTVYSCLECNDFLLPKYTCTECWQVKNDNYVRMKVDQILD